MERRREERNFSSKKRFLTQSKQKTVIFAVILHVSCILFFLGGAYLNKHFFSPDSWTFYIIPIFNSFILGLLLFKIIQLYRFQKNKNLHDTLTEVYAREFVISYIDRLIDKYNKKINQVSSSSSSFAVLMIDIDDFKKVNDRYGHEVGDRVLQAVSRVMEKNVRDYDIVARYGGEEFLVILPRTDKEKALKIAERIRQAVFSISVGPVSRLSVSIGLVLFEKGMDREDLLRTADKKMYQAKREGKNRVAF